MKRFNFAVGFVLAQEGGYVNDPRDAGGETKFGISKRAYPNVDIKNLTEGQAKVIYLQNYWTPMQCSQMPFGIAFCVFDFAVNAGIKRSAVRLQIAINRQSLQKIAEDGVIGPQTLRAMDGLDFWRLLTDFNALRIQYYFALRNTHAWAVPAWMRRVADTMTEITSLPDPWLLRWEEKGVK